MRRLVSIVSLLLLPASLAAQMEQMHGGNPSGQLGHVSFPISCNAAARPSFERGVALIHNFWFDQSAAAFRAAVAADSTCAMAWWGVASTYLHPLWAPPTDADLRAGADAVAHARALDPKTERERAWIAAIGAFFDSSATKPHIARLRSWSDAMGRVHQSFPADTEATIFHALSLIAIQPKTDTTFAQFKQAAGILEPLFARMPRHPGLAHYLIHAYDTPALVARAEHAAARYAMIAPDAPHALHMPSHTYSLLGQWDQSIATNIKSMIAAHRAGMDGRYDQLHAADYRVYAYLQEGRDSAAASLLRWAADSAILAGHPTAEFAMAAMVSRYALERDDWNAAKAVSLRAPLNNVIARGALAFTRTIGAARAGDVATARTEAAAFAPLETAAASQPDPFAPVMLRVNRLAATAWVALASGDTAGAMLKATDAADLEDNSIKNPLTPGPLLSARELLGDMQMAIGRPADAEESYRAALARTPRRLRSLSGGIKAAQAAGDVDAVSEWRGQLTALLMKGDRTRRQSLLAMR